MYGKRNNRSTHTYLSGDVSWRPVLAGVFLLILRLPGAVIDQVLFVDKTHRNDQLWLGVVILIAVSCSDISILLAIAENFT